MNCQKVVVVGTLLMQYQPTPAGPADDERHGGRCLHGIGLQHLHSLKLPGYVQTTLHTPAHSTALDI